jgi:hypothetical protein
VFHGYVAAAGKVGNGAGDLENAAVSAGGQAQLVDGGFQKTLRVVADMTEALDVAASHLGVAMELKSFEAVGLDRTGIADPLPDSA